MPSVTWSNRDSWPPTQLRLVRPTAHKSGQPRTLPQDMDEDPLTYFLTPVANGAGNDDDVDDVNAGDMLEFDAGIIETRKPPREIVRSVSPSTLDGLSKMRSKAASPDYDSDAITTDEDNDDEDYIHFSPTTPSFLSGAARAKLLAEDLMMLRRSKSPPFGRTAAGSLPSAASFPAPSWSPPPRGRTPRQGLIRCHSAGSSSSSSRLPPRARRLWREPSPDVWSISEETEEELLTQQVTTTTQSPIKSAFAEQKQGLNARAAKPKKQVRFLLPAKE